MSAVGFSLVGTGAIADFHARAFAASREARLVGVYSRSPERTREFAVRYGVRAFASLDEMLSSPEVEAVSIATPSGNHMEPAIASLTAGKHVLCEKPLEVTEERVEAILAAARTHRRHLAAVFQFRMGAGARRIKAAVEEGRFGRLTLCSAYIKWWRDQDYYDQGAWRGTRELDGGGALFNQGIHFVDLLQWLVGMPESVQASIATLAHERIEVEDTATAILRWPNGALGVIESATSAWPGLRSRIEISGDRGSAVMENERIVMWEFADRRTEDADALSADGQTGAGASDPKAISFHGHRLQIEDLAAAIRNDRPPAVPGEEALHAVRLIRAIYRAASSGVSVSLREA